MTQVLNYLFSGVSSLASWFTELERDIMLQTSPFGAKQWMSEYQLELDEPKIPEKFQQALKAPCPFWPSKSVEKTHFLCLVPKNLSLADLHELIENGALPRTMHSSDLGDAYWILVTKKVVPKTSALPFETQKQVLSAEGYDAPHSIEAAVAAICARHNSVAAFSTRDEATRCYERSNSSHIAVGSDPHAHFCEYGNNWDRGHGVVGVIR